MGEFQHRVLCTWQLPWLAVECPWSAPNSLIFSFSSGTSTALNAGRRVLYLLTNLNLYRGLHAKSVPRIDLHPTVTNFIFLTFLPLVIADYFSSSGQCTKFLTTLSPSQKTWLTSGQGSKTTHVHSPCVCKLIAYSIRSHKFFYVPSTSTLWNGLPPVITCLSTYL